MIKAIEYSCNIVYNIHYNSLKNNYGVIILKAITIKDVAEKAGVSIATVSRVINETDNVSDQVKLRVKEVIAEMNFKPNPVARSLVMKKSRIIGVIVPDISNFFMGEIISGIEEAIRSYSYDIIICNTYGKWENEIRYLDLFVGKQVEGIIYMSWKLENEVVEHIDKLEIPVVMINRNTSRWNIPSVSIDNYKAAFEMTNYLLKKGHRKIALIRNGIDRDAFGLEQYKGYKQALSEYNIDVQEKYVKYGNFSIDNSYNIVKKFIEDDDLPTAIFSTSDVMAIGAINALRDSGLRVPEDVSVVGFNDVRLATMYRPKLTVIHQPLFSIGTVAVKIVMDKVNGKETSDNIVIVPYSLIERETVKECSQD